jgi:hypothetical protein
LFLADLFSSSSNSSLSEICHISGSLKISDSLLFIELPYPPLDPNLEFVSPAVFPAIEAASVPLKN